MKHENVKDRRRTPSPAMIVAVIALIVALGGSAYAFSVPRNSVGTRQLQAKSVTNGKLANEAITAAKVVPGSLTGSDIDLASLGSVPQATNASNASNSNTVDNHSATCPPSTTLIRGLCFDTTSSEANNLEEANEACAAKGGYLPSPMELLSVKNILNLGTGIGSDFQYTDEYYYDATNNDNPSTVVVDGTGTITQVKPTTAARYTCVYPLVR